MLDRLRERLEEWTDFGDDEDEEEEETGFSDLRWITAGLFVAAGAEAALGERRGDYRAPEAIRWAPLVAAPLAGVAHAARAAFPNESTRAFTQIANGIAIGVGAAGLAASVYSALSQRDAEDGAEPVPPRLPSLAPLAFCAVGLLGMVLDEEEEDAEERQTALRRRANVVERLVPARRPRFDHVVVHI